MNKGSNHNHTGKQYHHWLWGLTFWLVWLLVFLYSAGLVMQVYHQWATLSAGLAGHFWLWLVQTIPLMLLSIGVKRRHSQSQLYLSLILLFHFMAAVVNVFSGVITVLTILLLATIVLLLLAIIVCLHYHYSNKHLLD